MKVTFTINYHTVWGESLHICGDLPSLGSNDSRKALEMRPTADGNWQATVTLDDPRPSFSYFFIVKAPGKAWRFEWGVPHRFENAEGVKEAFVFDSWHDLPHDKPFYSSAFTDGMLARPRRSDPAEGGAGKLVFRVEAPMVGRDEMLAIAGEGDLLGDWNPAGAPRFSDAHFPVWEIALPLDSLPTSFAYKFLIVDKKGRARAWEPTPNRIYGIRERGKEQMVVIDGIRFSTPELHWKGAGTAIPVFSIRTEKDFGIGDFIDIMEMTDWCEATGQKILQLLPVNDTTMTGTWLDSYPYKANSPFALHPVYMRLEEAGVLADPARRVHYERLREELNALPAVDYERVSNAKEAYMRELFAQDFAKISKTPRYREFRKANDGWLRPYTAWRVLRDLYGSADHLTWGRHAAYSDESVEQLLRERSAEADFYCFEQYHLDRQLRAAREYAHAHGVVLKGDIPIGINRCSVDAWQYPGYFNMDSQAGAPPDDFSVTGQNWGFPTYNWEAMACDGFRWWKDRFRKMADYFDAYRIDHILGFFRIWEIPECQRHGLLGHFNPALPYSPDELLNTYGFRIDPALHIKPLIADNTLGEQFGPQAETVKERFLDSAGEGRYQLRNFIDSQRKVEDYFSGKESESDRQLKEALMNAIDNVLFIEDSYEKGHYHPRIAAQNTIQYSRLSDGDKWNFNRLYNDFYYHRHNGFWRGKAMWKLPPLLDSTRMLACGEDLGMIPECVPSVMQELEILSLEIQRMPKESGTEFGNTAAYPYYSVCTTSTHDMEGVRQWWEDDHVRAQHYYNNVLHAEGEAPREAESWVCGKILELHLQSPSMLCILPLQDWLSTDSRLRRPDARDERINVPTDPRNYWRYRMHLTVADLLGQRSFNAMISDSIAESGR